MKHLFIPDCQVKPGDDTSHLLALGRYIADKKPDKIINIGDFADMPSLSSYEKPGSKYFEGKSYKEDTEAAKEANDLLLKPLRALQERQRANKKRVYSPEMHLCLGNHEHRITRAIHTDPVKLEGVIGIEDLEYDKDWIVHPFLDVVNLDGILYSHYFVNQLSLKKNVLGGTMDNKLQKIGSSFSMGHQQTLQYGMRYLTDGTRHQGLVCGAFYQHEEEYMGPQGNHYWCGVVIKNQVKDGTYDPCFVSIDYLMRKYL